MTRTKATTKPAATVDGVELLPVATTPINLHDLEAVRREMSRVYRDMRSDRIDTQDGTRLFADECPQLMPPMRADCGTPLRTLANEVQAST